MNRETTEASAATVSRLPGYLNFLVREQAAGTEIISSTAIAENLALNPVQVRKDLAIVSSVAGKPKVGFRVSELIRDINAFLGCNDLTDAAIAGIGGLGKALLHYKGFENYGVRIALAFDADPHLIGTKIAERTIFPAQEITAETKKSNIKIGIIAVPKEYAQETAERFVRGGVTAIWNFAPTHLRLPDSVLIRNEDLAVSLAILSKKLDDSAPSN